MSRICCITSCQAAYNDTGYEDIHLHALPKNENLRKSWCEWISNINGVNIEELKKTLYVCHHHFEEKYRGAKRLKKGAIPTIPNIQIENENTTRSHHAEVYNDYTTVVEVDMSNTQENNVCTFHGDSVLKNENCKSMTSNNVLDSIAFPIDTDIVIVNQDELQIDSAQENLQLIHCNIVALEEFFYDNSCLQQDLNNEQVCEVLCDQSETTAETSQLHCQPLSESKGKTSKLGKKCSADGCSNPQGSFFTFPAIIKSSQLDETGFIRCKQWVKHCGNRNLLDIPSSDLHQRKFLCSLHFDDSQFFNKMKKRLRPDAIPTIFDAKPLTDEEMIQYPVHGQRDIDIAIRQGDPENDDNQMYGLDDRLDIYQKKFTEELFSLEWRVCSNCKARFFCKRRSQQKCVYTKTTCEKFKDLQLDEVPEELNDLTYIEEQLIAKVHPVVSIIKLKGHQYGYKGNVINFPQDVTGFAKTLPHKISDLSCVLTIRASKNLQPVDFQVRAEKVKNALTWLKNNNRHYFDIEISAENLELLPKDSNVFELVQGFNIDEDRSDETKETSSSESCQEKSTPCHESVINDNPEDFEDQPQEKKTRSMSSPSQESNDSDNPEDCDDVYESGSPIMTKAASSDQIESVLSWPSINNEPINEFNDDTYIVQAFPCLFPKGNGNLRIGNNQLVSALNYFKHLMRYEDERFSKHNRFRYFALNSYMRWSALKNGRLFVKTRPEFDKMTLNQLKEELVKNPSMLKKIMCRNSSIAGSNAYWFARGKELLNMVEQIGIPTLFFTLSAADLHWPDLFKLLAPHEDFNNLSDHRRRQLVKMNPLIVDTFFLKRAEIFMDEVITKKFKVKDFWFRVEYQHRGSPHLHGVLWIEDAPDVLNILKKSEEEQQRVVDYFNELVTAFHPNLDQPPNDIHPCKKKLIDIADLDQDLPEILNKVQRHTLCSKQYCVRKSKKTNDMKCRFKFPQEYQEKAKLNVNEDGNVEFLPKRNDERLNKYNPYIIQTWRANIDVAPVISKNALINYLAKYVTKSEHKSSHLTDLMSIINETTDKNKSAKHAIQRLYIKACSERDFSAQETCHLLMGLKLYSSGNRHFVTINFNNNEEWRLLRNDESATSLIEKYQNRSDRLAAKCLWHVAKYHEMPTENKRPKEAIVQVYPKFRKNVEDSEKQENYYRQQVLLYVPWTNEQQLKGDKATWKEVYDVNKETIAVNMTQNCSLNGMQPEEQEFEEEINNNRIDLEEWMAVSAMGPHQDIPAISLGSREIDTNYNWHESSNLYEQYGGIPSLLTFIKRMKTQTEHNDVAQINLTEVTLSDEQHKVIDLVKLQICALKEGNNDLNETIPQTSLIQGKAGTGKSMVIAKIAELISSEFGQNSCLLLGPTGVSAININGSTIHSKLLIKTNEEEFSYINGKQLHTFINTMRNARFVIVDEFSMVGCKMMYMIDQRLRQAKDRPQQTFGGMFMYFFGDINQLPPVHDTPAYSSNQQSMEAIAGKILYDNIDKAFVLEKIHRQHDEKFQNLLNNISSGTITAEDYQILQTRFITKVPGTERTNFEDAPRFYPTNEEKNKYNFAKLSNMKDPVSKSFKPVAKIPAKVSNKNAKSVSLGDEGLESLLYLSKGSKIMLRSNLWTERGLVNGSIGEVVDIVYDTNATPQEDPPSVLICKFNSYIGPYLDEENKTVPIAPIQVKSGTGNDEEKATISQFPVCLSYGCTIHKSQGLTLTKAYIQLGKKESNPGLTYVALSRVKTIEGLLLEPFPLSRLLNINKSKAIVKRKQWLQNLVSKQFD